MFIGKTEKIKDSPQTKKKLIYTLSYIAKVVSCVFTDDPSDEMKDCNIETGSEALISCLNQFFSECNDTRHIAEVSVDELTVDQVATFKEDSLLGRSVGLEILGRLLYCTYDKENEDFDTERVSQIAQLDWSRAGQVWRDNVVLSSPNPKNTAKSYKITASANAVRIAVNMAKTHLGWI